MVPLRRLPLSSHGSLTLGHFTWPRSSNSQSDFTTCFQSDFATCFRNCDDHSTSCHWQIREEAPNSMMSFDIMSLADSKKPQIQSQSYRANATAALVRYIVQHWKTFLTNSQIQLSLLLYGCRTDVFTCFRHRWKVGACARRSVSKRMKK